MTARSNVLKFFMQNFLLKKMVFTKGETIFFKRKFCMKNFRAYDLAVSFYRFAARLELPRHLKEQLLRAASSIVLNLAEGNGRRTRADRKRFFVIAFASLRECQAILDLGLGEKTEV